MTFGERRAETAAADRRAAGAPRRSSRSSTAGGRPSPASGGCWSASASSATPGLLVLHPVGTLQISQRFVPLNLPLDKVGNQKPSDVNKATVTVDAGGVARRARPDAGAVRRRAVPRHGRRGEAVGARVRAARERRASSAPPATPGPPDRRASATSATRRSSSTPPSSGSRSALLRVLDAACSSTSAAGAADHASRRSRWRSEKKHQPFAEQGRGRRRAVHGGPPGGQHARRPASDVRQPRRGAWRTSPTRSPPTRRWPTRSTSFPARRSNVVA